MRAEIAVGTELWIKLPYGHFYLTETPSEETILIAGGTGIAPFIAFIQKEILKPTDVSLTLVYGVKKTKFVLFSDILLRAAKNIDRFKLHIFSEENVFGTSLKKNTLIEYIRGIGKLSIDRIWQVVDNPEAATFYLSGPPDMISSFRSKLLMKGITENKIKIDDWE